MKKNLAIFALAASALFANAAHAAAPVGLWKVDQYDFVYGTLVNSMQTCFYSNGTAKQGASILAPDWSGNWKKSQSFVLLRMSNTDGASVATYSLVVNTQNLMTGLNQSYKYYDPASGFYINSVWTYLGADCTQPPTP